MKKIIIPVIVAVLIGLATWAIIWAIDMDGKEHKNPPVPIVTEAVTTPVATVIVPQTVTDDKGDILVEPPVIVTDEVGNAVTDAEGNVKTEPPVAVTTFVAVPETEVPRVLVDTITIQETNRERSYNIYKVGNVIYFVANENIARHDTIGFDLTLFWDKEVMSIRPRIVVPDEYATRLTTFNPEGENGKYIVAFLFGSTLEAGLDLFQITVTGNGVLTITDQKTDLEGNVTETYWVDVVI